MAVPTEDRSKPGTYYNDDPSVQPQDQSPIANGQTSLSIRPHDQSNVETSSPATHDRKPRSSTDRQHDPSSEKRSKSSGRRPSGQQRTCGKCQRHLTGQFVRALGDTYHLECFTCHVSAPGCVAMGCKYADEILGLWQDCRLEVLSRT